VTVASTLADSYVSSSERSAGAAAELAATRKCEKYVNMMPVCFIFQPIAIENVGVMNVSAYDFFHEFGRKIGLISGEICETKFLFQRISIVVQRFDSVLHH
jgi:hypothetical protein